MSNHLELEHGALCEAITKADWATQELTLALRGREHLKEYHKNSALNHLRAAVSAVESSLVLAQDGAPVLGVKK
jgi:hypothetical protein